MTTASNQRVKTDGITVPDIVLIVLIVALSTGIVLNARLDLSWRPAAAARASIYQSGKLDQVLDLREDRQINLLNGKMVLEIRDNKIRVKESDCPRKVCMRVGWVSHPGEAIVCVPYKTAIEIGTPEKSAVDAVVF